MRYVILILDLDPRLLKALDLRSLIFVHDVLSGHAHIYAVLHAVFFLITVNAPYP